MVQVMGNRILGGIGAPGGGMAESFGAGVNTALDQRTSRQNMEQTAQTMRMRDQELAWRAEDRKRAQAAAAAAAANAAAARAAGRTAIAGLQTSTAGKYFTVGGGRTPAAPAASSAGRALPRSMGAVAPAAVSGVAGLRGGPGTDDLTSKITNIQSVQGTLPPSYAPVPGAFINSYGEVDMLSEPKGRPGDFAAQATQRALANSQSINMTYGAAGVSLGMQAGRLGSSNLPAMFDYRDSINERIAASVRAKQEGKYGEDLTQLAAERDRMDAEIAVAQMTPSEFLRDRSITAEEGPGTSAQLMGPPSNRSYFTAIRINGPNGPVDVATDDATAEPYVSNPSLPVGERNFAGAPSRLGTPPDSAQPEQVDIPGFGAPAPLPSGLGEANLSFGPKLGAAPTPAQMFFMDVGRTKAGNIDLEALAADQNSPLYGDDFSAAAEASRAYYQYAAEQAYQKGDVGAYADAVAKIKEQETLILTQQLMLGEREASSYNSAQRLNAVASIVYGGADVFIQPKGNGNADLYVDGRLYDKDVDVSALAMDMRMMIDKDYRDATNAAMGEAAKLQAERDFEFGKIDRQGAVNQQTERVKAEFALELASANSESRSAEDLQSKVNALDVEVLRQSYIADGVLKPEREIKLTVGANDVIFLTDDLGNEVAQFIPETDPDTGATSYKELRR